MHSAWMLPRLVLFYISNNYLHGNIFVNFFSFGSPSFPLQFHQSFQIEKTFDFKLEVPEVTTEKLLEVIKDFEATGIWVIENKGL